MHYRTYIFTSCPLPGGKPFAQRSETMWLRFSYSKTNESKEGIKATSKNPLLLFKTKDVSKEPREQPILGKVHSFLVKSLKN